MKIVLTILLTFACILGFATPAIAAPKVTTATGTLTGPLPGSVLALGGTVNFSASWANVPRQDVIEVLVECFQGPQIVYGAIQTPPNGPNSGVGNGNPNWLSWQLGLSSSYWLDHGGDATCNATLFFYDNRGPIETYHQLAQTPDFVAAG